MPRYAELRPCMQCKHNSDYHKNGNECSSLMGVRTPWFVRAAPTVQTSPNHDPLCHARKVHAYGVGAWGLSTVHTLSFQPPDDRHWLNQPPKMKPIQIGLLFTC